MSRRFKGESVHKVDAKGRVSIPAQFRRVLEEGDPDWVAGAAPSLVVIHGRTEARRLECFTIRAMEQLDDLVSSMNAFDDDTDDLAYVLNSQAAYVSLDDTGRILLSQKLRDAAGLGDEATFSGMGDRFDIWESGAYAAHAAEMAARRHARGGAGVAQLLEKARRERAGGGA